MHFFVEASCSPFFLQKKMLEGATPEAQCDDGGERTLGTRHWSPAERMRGTKKTGVVRINIQYLGLP